MNRSKPMRAKDIQKLVTDRVINNDCIVSIPT